MRPGFWDGVWAMFCVFGLLVGVANIIHGKADWFDYSAIGFGPFGAWYCWSGRP